VARVKAVRDEDAGMTQVAVPTDHESALIWPPHTADISLTLGQRHYLLALLELDPPPLDWGRNRRAAIRAKLLATLQGARDAR
jgi:hypothetical protein